MEDGRSRAENYTKSISTRRFMTLQGWSWEACGQMQRSVSRGLTDSVAAD